MGWDGGKLVTKKKKKKKKGMGEEIVEYLRTKDTRFGIRHSGLPVITRYVTILPARLHLVLSDAHIPESLMRRPMHVPNPS